MINQISYKIESYNMLGRGQTPYFTWAESHANGPKEGEQRDFLSCIRFGSCEVRRLTRALVPFPITREHDIT